MVFKWPVVFVALCLVITVQLEPAHGKRPRRVRHTQKGGYLKDVKFEMLDSDTFAVYRRAFSGDECARLRSAAQALPTVASRIVNGAAPSSAAGISVNGTRKNRIFIVPRQQKANFEWLYRRIEAIGRAANEQIWRFGSIAHVEDLQISAYDADDGGGYYDWHFDVEMAQTDEEAQEKSSGPYRVLSLSIQLSEPSAYAGGELLLGPAQRHRAPMDAGTAVIFPSYSFHTPCNGYARAPE
jgi:predicted 2-oxoglutarate/Fe(II)-dependent dioxygenase YbiX